jgi:hypothetical protein
MATTTESKAQTAAGQNDNFIVTSCPDHGTKEVGNFESFKVYVECAHDDEFGWRWHADGPIERLPHAVAFDPANGTDPRRCCAQMLIDPFGYLDF